MIQKRYVWSLAIHNALAERRSWKMARRVIFYGLCFVFLGFSPDARGTIVDQDYFTAKISPDVKELLRLVDTYHTDRVMESIKNHNMKMAMVDLEYTLTRFPNHPRALMFIGSVAKLTKNPSLAIPYYEKALKLYPQYAITHAQYGLYLLDSGNIKAGTERLKRSVALDPNLAVAHAWMAKAYLKSGNTELARQAVLRARELGYKGQID